MSFSDGIGRRWLAALLPALLALAGCASQFVDPQEPGRFEPRLQNRLLLTPANGGQNIAPSELEPGDIILSSASSLSSIGIRALSLAPVSHAAVYLGEDRIIEAVGSGVQLRSVEDFLAEESTIVAFRHPDITSAQAERMQDFALAQLGKKYNPVGIFLQAPFTLSRQACELPVIPSLVRDFRIRGLAAIHLGAARNDRFFCSQFVLQAYQEAGLPLTTADPLLVSPADLLHMREGDVPSVRTERALLYVGHLKAGDTATATAETDFELWQ